MLPQRPDALDSDFHSAFTAGFSHGEATDTPTRPVEHHCQVCPNCSRRLTSYRCKLVCTECGYYLSCADYY